MNGLKDKWAAVLWWLRWFYDALVWIGCGFFVDSLIPDLPGSLGMGRLRLMVWRMSTELGVPWRVNESLWTGIRACFKAHADMKRAGRELRKLEAQLKPLMEAYGEPGETPQEFVNNRLPRLMELAKIGDQARREQEKQARSTEGSNRSCRADKS